MGILMQKSGRLKKVLKVFLILIIIAVVGVTPLCKSLAEKIDIKKTLIMILEPLIVLFILIASTAAMVDGSFNPFIYFRF